MDASKSMKEEKLYHNDNEIEMRKDKKQLKEDYKNNEYTCIGDIEEQERLLESQLHDIR